MRIKVDMSDYAMGGVLLMEEEDGLWRPVAFLLKSLNETERNYEIHDKEMLWKVHVSSSRSGQITRIWNTS